jgi:serine palmitoyltransferase
MIWAFLEGLIRHSVEHPFTSLIQLFMFLWIVYLYSMKSYKTKEPEPLTNQEIESLIEDWRPEPLVPPNEDTENINSELRIVESNVGAHAIVDGKECVNFACTGFLEFQMHPKVIATAIECSSVYGIGSCGPRGFYGSIQPHMDLETKIANFMGTEEAVIFSSNFQTIASVIPAFSSIGDVLICDKGINLAIQNGIYLSRAKVSWFNHNDIQDLVRILGTESETFRKKRKRVFVIIEGIYANYGDIANLPEIMELKKQYPFRLIIEESFSIGVLGNTGRGITEHFNIPLEEIEIITGSLSNSLGGVGGFAIGNQHICNHMRLNCTGYVFSASLPPYISASCMQSIDLMRDGDDLRKLSDNSKYLNEKLKEITEFLITMSDQSSPVIHLRLTIQQDNKSSQKILSSIVNAAFEDKLILSHSRYLPREQIAPSPSIKVYVSSKHTKEELDQLVSSLKKITSKIL